jgi:hypothetical protein
VKRWGGYFWNGGFLWGEWIEGCGRGFETACLLGGTFRKEPCGLGKHELRTGSSRLVGFISGYDILGRLFTVVVSMLID